MLLDKARITTKTELDIRELMGTFRCLTPDQLVILMPKQEGRTPDAIRYAAEACLSKRQIVIQDDGVLLSTVHDKVDHAFIDAVWMMISHLGPDGIPESSCLPARCASREEPVRLCYTKDGIVYYVLFLTSSTDLLRLRVAEERIKSQGSGDTEALAAVRFLIGAWDERLLQNIPTLSYKVVRVLVNRSSGWSIDLPRFQYITNGPE